MVWCTDQQQRKGVLRLELSLGRWRQERGRRTEERFFHAVQNPQSKPPDWFVEVRKVSPADDRKGVDAVGVVIINGHKVSVPIQVKTSWIGWARYRSHRTEPHYGAVIVIVVPPNYSYPKIRKIAYLALEDIVKQGTRRGIDKFWRKLRKSA